MKDEDLEKRLDAVMRAVRAVEQRVLAVHDVVSRIENRQAVDLGFALDDYAPASEQKSCGCRFAQGTGLIPCPAHQAQARQRPAALVSRPTPKRSDDPPV